MSNITISDSCTSCLNCVSVCPSMVYEQRDEKVLPEKANLCILCGHCIASCPTDAIDIADIAETTEFTDISEFADPAQNVEYWLKTRRSVRNFTNDQIPDEILEKILKWGESAPRAHNSNAFELIVIQNKELLTQIEQTIADELAALMQLLRNKDEKQNLVNLHGDEKVNIWRKMLPELRFITNQVKSGKLSLMHHAPTLIIAASDKQHLQMDITAQLALHQISLGAHNLQLGSFWFGFLMIVSDFSSKIIELLDIENTLKIAGAILLGKPTVKYRKGISRKLKTKRFC